MVTTLWLLTGWFATVTALLLLARIGRLPPFRPLAPERRCPRCGYDLSHTNGRTCSECGHAARREWHLRLHPRRRRSLALALLVASLTIPAQRAERIEAHGWVAGMPTTVLVLAAPWTIDAYTTDIWPFERPDFRAPRASVSHQLTEELLVRQSDASLGLARWQEWLLVEIAGRHITSSDEPITASSGGPVTAGVSRALSEALRRDRVTPRQRRAVMATILVSLRVPKAWPLDATTSAQLDVISWVRLDGLEVTARHPRTEAVLDRVRIVPTYSPSGWYQTGFATLAAPWAPWIMLDRVRNGNETPSYQLDLAYQDEAQDWQPLGHHIVRVSRPATHAAHRNRAVRDVPSLDAVLRTASLSPESAYGPEHPVVVFDGLEAWESARPRSDEHGVPNESTEAQRPLIAVRIEWRRGTTVLASRAECWGWIETPDLPMLRVVRNEIYLCPRASADALSRIEPGDILRITSDPDLALRDPKRRPYWEGVIEIELEAGPEPADGDRGR